MQSYRQIYKEYYGEIPTDSNGITFDIHHIDGNRRNNNISNLKAISVKEHYEIHKSQGDWLACNMISSRLNLTLEEKLEINKKMGDALKSLGDDHPSRKLENRKKLSISGKLSYTKELRELRAKNLRGKFGSKHPSSIKINQYTLDNVLIKTWESAADIQRELKIFASAVAAVCKQKRKTSGGYIFKYENL